VIGEGIESEEQFVFLSKLGCDQGQGRFFAPPLPADVIEARFLQKHKN
jgi:EAL domain-containing protein (putative c-di-GMP-specific phosphodiesterase class I)